MPMPMITPAPRPMSMSQAVTDLIESIALEECALSNILNTEGDKIQCAIAIPDITLGEILEVNNSVMNMVEAIASLESILKDKLEFISNNLYYPSREQTHRCEYCE